MALPLFKGKTETRWLQGLLLSLSWLLEQREGWREWREKGYGYPGTPNELGQQWKPALPRTPNPSIPLPCPPVPSIGPGRASQLWDLGGPGRQAVTLADVGIRSLSPAASPILGNSSKRLWQKDFSRGPLDDNFNCCSLQSIFQFLSEAPWNSCRGASPR